MDWQLVFGLLGIGFGVTALTVSIYNHYKFYRKLHRRRG